MNLGLSDADIEKRRGGVSSTDLRVILAYYAGKEGRQVAWPLRAGESALGLYAEKLGHGRPYTMSDPMKAGLYLQNALLRWYSDDTGFVVDGNDVTIEHTQNPRHMATPDGFAWLPDSPYVDRGVEVKTVWGWEQCARWGDGDAVPAEYYLQCQWCMYVRELPRWDIAVLLADGHGVQFRIYHLERNDEQIAKIVPLVDRFLTEHVDAGVPPEPDGSTSAAQALADLAPADATPCRLAADSAEEDLIDELIVATDEYKDAGKRRELLKQRVMALANEEGIVGIETPSGQRVYRDKAGRVQVKG